MNRLSAQLKHALYELITKLTFLDEKKTGKLEHYYYTLFPHVCEFEAEINEKNTPTILFASSRGLCAFFYNNSNYHSWYDNTARHVYLGGGDTSCGEGVEQKNAKKFNKFRFVKPCHYKPDYRKLRYSQLAAIFDEVSKSAI